MCSSSRAHVRVTFLPEGRSVYVLAGSVLIEAAARAGMVLDTPCGGGGTCGKCRVQITDGAPEPCEADRRHLSARELAEGFRLACQTRVTEDMRVSVPVSARFFDARILTDGRGAAVPLHPTVTKHHAVPPEPTIEDQAADVDRLLAAIPEKDVEPGLDVLRDIPAVLRRAHYDVTAICAEGALIAVEPGDTTDRNHGMAFDIGTTTVAGYLMDLVTGRELAVAARTNPQVAFGDDVVARIGHASDKPGGLSELQSKIVACMNEIVAECSKAAGIAPEDIYEIAAVGNTTMNHLLLGIPPDSIAQAPYVAALRRRVNTRAAGLGLKIHPNGLLHTLPNIAGFVGADTVGVILAARLHEAEDATLAIDIGTNGELVVGNRDRLIACSTAAGPAFEGARIKFGMRAAEGAIDKILVNDDLDINVIGDAVPRGLCGTALIDLVAELLRVGVIDPSGRLLPPEDMPKSAPDVLKRRVVEGENNSFDFVIVPQAETSLDSDLTLTQRDVRELQLAKGAIFAGVNILLGEFGVEPEKLGHVLLAGAFGNFIRRKMAKRIGLLPDIPTDRILYVGNAAGAGARMALQSRRCKDTAEEISERTEYLELAGRADFQDEFMSAMMFPEA